MTLGLIVAILPFLGFPYEVDKWICTFAGFAIVAVLYFSKHGRIRREVNQHTEESVEREGGSPHALHTEHTEVEDHPRMHIEHKTIIDTLHRHDGGDTDTLVEKKMTVARRHKQKSEKPPAPEEATKQHVNQEDNIGSDQETERQ